MARPFIDKEKERTRAATYYAANKTKVLDRMARYREESRQIISEAKAVPCADCGGTFPEVCMQFHHLDPSIKSGIVSNLGHPTSVRKEIAKCVVVCANCHCIRHGGTQ